MNRIKFSMAASAATASMVAALLIPGAGATGAAVVAARGGAPGRAAVAPAGGARAASRVHHLISVVSQGSRFHSSQSNNWSGYNQGILDTDTPFSSITGSWIVPRAHQHLKGQAEYSSTWIGIGGGCLNTTCAATDSTLIQAGTEQDVSAKGTATYSAWWELVPVPSVTASIKVHPGDRINCSISQVVPGVWSISLKDATDRQGFTETLPYPSDETTAEWIVETPVVLSTSSTGLAALPDLGVVRFFSAKVNGKAADLLADQAVQLVSSSNKPVATPSAPTGSGSFSDCTWASRCRATRR